MGCHWVGAWQSSMVYDLPLCPLGGLGLAQGRATVLRQAAGGTPARYWRIGPYAGRHGGIVISWWHQRGCRRMA